MIVQVEIGSSRLLAEVTRDAVTRLAITPGVRIFALIKSVSIEVQGPALLGENGQEPLSRGA